MKIFMRDSKYHVYLCYEGRMLRKSLKTTNRKLAQDLAKEISRISRLSARRVPRSLIMENSEDT